MYFPMFFLWVSALLGRVGMCLLSITTENSSGNTLSGLLLSSLPASQNYLRVKTGVPFSLVLQGTCFVGANIHLINPLTTYSNKDIYRTRYSALGQQVNISALCQAAT